MASAVVVAILGLLVFAPSATSAPAAKAATHATSFTNIPVTGTTTSGQTFTGRMDITRFAVSGGAPAAVGTITGVAKNASGVVVRSVIDAPAVLPVAMPSTGGAAVAQASSSTCTILHLVLGPLDLNLLGLHVHLNQVVLDITAQRGPGQLLGNLLCAIAHLLDGASAGVLAQLLTAVTRIVALTSALG